MKGVVIFKGIGNNRLITWFIKYVQDILVVYNIKIQYEDTYIYFKSKTKCSNWEELSNAVIVRIVSNTDTPFEIRRVWFL